MDRSGIRCYDSDRKLLLPSILIFIYLLDRIINFYYLFINYLHILFIKINYN